MEMAERLQKLRRKAVSVPKSGKCSAALRSSPVPHWSQSFLLLHWGLSQNFFYREELILE